MASAPPLPIQRLPKMEDGPTSTVSPPYSSNPKKRWSNWLPLFVALVVVAEIGFLGRLDMAKNVDLVNSWADSFYQFTTSSLSSMSTVPAADDGFTARGGDAARIAAERDSRRGLESCEEWLEKEDTVAYSRDFEKYPIFVHGGEQEWKFCAVGCTFGAQADRTPDAAFGMPQSGGTASILRSMESAEYYAENNIAMARRWEGIRHCNDYKSFFRCSCWIFLMG
nr:glycoprotein 3-alpha-L-fucosyltransferase A-like [Ipomoea batatas]GMC83341.1 glycoprotein 3-alpha-L-fucosyltransferase A-like [Ipomoea batatas]GMC85441.1 glycoprotein 3-alpha-L-fucosyltransferase A-like [Ipomoea batatas]